MSPTSTTVARLAACSILVTACAHQPPVTADDARAHPACLRDPDEHDIPDHCTRRVNPTAGVAGSIFVGLGAASAASGLALMLSTYAHGPPDVPGEPFIGMGLGMVALGIPLMITGLRSENPYVDALKNESLRPGESYLEPVAAPEAP